MLQREGIQINHKKTYRLYRTAGLTLKKRSKKKYEKRGMPGRTITEPNVRWSMDFVSDKTRYGSNIRVLTVIDEVTRECLALEADSSITGRKVTAVLNRIAIFRGMPQEILTDNGPEFTSNAMNAWAYDHKVEHILQKVLPKYHKIICMITVHGNNLMFPIFRNGLFYCVECRFRLLKSYGTCT